MDLLTHRKSQIVKGHPSASHFLLSSGTLGCAGSLSASGIKGCGYWFKLSLQAMCPLQHFCIPAHHIKQHPNVLLKEPVRQQGFKAEFPEAQNLYPLKATSMQI